MTDIFHNPRAFAPMMELVSWLQDAAPHRRGIIRAAVFQGESQSSAAGPTLDGVTADPWSVKVPITDALVTQIAMGDTLTLSPRHGNAVLTVQQITATPNWYVIRCTANERAPANGG